MKKYTKKTVRFSATIGVVEGYEFNNVHIDSAKDIVSLVWQKYADIVFDEIVVYVSTIIVESRAIYQEERGCPKGGEKTATVFGEANPLIVEDMELWKKAVIEIIKLIKDELKQESIFLIFTDVDESIYFEY